MAEAAASNNNDDIPIQVGKVGRVCQDWLIKEDGAFAYHLQSEEISRHYQGNRDNSHLVRTDFHQAKHLQQDEYNEMLLRYENELQEQLDLDEQLAKEIQDEELRTEANQELQSSEERDLLLAQKLQAKEKQRLLRRRIAKEKREVEKLRSHDVSGQDPSENGLRNPSASGHASNSDATEIDLSEFCLQPPPGLSESELQSFQAEQDAELARFLQQQEAKKEALKEKLIVIESQDHELAQILQQQERAKVKRLKERARIKAMSKSNGQASNDNHSRASDEYIVFQHQERPNSNNQPTRPHDDQPPEAHHYSDSPSQRDGTILASQDSGLTNSNFHNIAMDLDPTYNKTHMVETVMDENGLHFARLCRVSPCSSESASPISTVRSHGELQQDFVSQDFGGEAGQYLPVQGHRRNAPEKMKKSKKTKDGCKTQ